MSLVETESGGCDSHVRSDRQCITSYKNRRAEEIQCVLAVDTKEDGNLGGLTVALRIPTPNSWRRPFNFWHTPCTFRRRSAHATVGNQELWCTGEAGEPTSAAKSQPQVATSPTE